jgi:hypothetical protein
VWQHLHEFVSQRFEEYSPVPTEEALLFIAENFDLRVLPNTFRNKVRADAKLRMIRGIPIEKERFDCDMTEIELYIDKLSENMTDVFAAFFSISTDPDFRTGRIDEKEL